jgi:hypothetical protein
VELSPTIRCKSNNGCHQLPFNAGFDFVVGSARCAFEPDRCFVKNLKPKLGTAIEYFGSLTTLGRQGRASCSSQRCFVLTPGARCRRAGRGARPGRLLVTVMTILAPGTAPLCIVTVIVTVWGAGDDTNLSLFTVIWGGRLASLHPDDSPA